MSTRRAIGAVSPRQEINAGPTAELECVLVRNGQEPVVVNLDIEPVEPPETLAWVDPLHPAPASASR